MATVEPAGATRATRPRKSLTPDLLEKIVAAGSILMLAALLIALARGWGSWNRIPVVVWLHLFTIGTALALTPILMLKPRGTRWHRRLGWAWCIAMFATAAISFGIRGIGQGGFSLIHILSGITVIAVPALVMAARRHRVEQHRRAVRLITVGALLIAGFFTLIPSRTLGFFLFG